MTKTFSDHFKNQKSITNLNAAAILVVDLLNDFMVEGGAMVLNDSYIIIEPNQKLITAARKRGIPIIYINDNHRPGKYDREFDKRTEHCIDGTWGALVIKELEPADDDYIIKKRRYSGFFQTDLHLVLGELNIKTVIITGIVTNICIRSTVHDAFFLGYNVIVPKDCVMATGPREQESSLWDIETHYGSITTSAELLKLLNDVT